MNKKSFLSLFEDSEMDDAVKAYEIIETAFEYGVQVSSDQFFAPNIWKVVEIYLSKSSLRYEDDGLFEPSERRILRISGDDFCGEINDGYSIVKIENKSKFKKLDHKHYLGTIMSMGIKREKLGDLVVKDNICYFPCIKGIDQYIVSNLEKINGCAVKVEIYSDDFEQVKNIADKKEISVITSSMRIDCLVSVLGKTSRSKVEKMIGSKKILVNYKTVQKKNSEVKEGDIITIRGTGKFYIKAVVGETKKERIKLQVLRF